MNTMKNLMPKGMLLIALIFTLTQCIKDDNEQNLKGTAEFEITDAPIDDVNIKGVFVTVAAVKVDGETISNFNGKQTIDLMAYQNGNTKALGLAELEAGNYNNVSLVLDYGEDANGNAPGCYVLTEDNTKHDLQSSTNSTSELVLNGSNFIIEEKNTTNLVLDFDIRKAIKRQELPQTNDEYDLVTEAEQRSSIRIVNQDITGELNGAVNDMLDISGDRIVVYAYKKGTFTKEIETQGQGDSNILFKNAITSTIVADDGGFTLAFLEEGEYELHFVGYEDNDSDGMIEAKGMLEVSSLTSVDLLGFQLDAGTNINIEVSVLSVIPF